MKVAVFLPLLLASIASVWSLPTAAKDALPSSFASEASQLIATQLLKYNKDIDANQVHSPLGVAAILAVLAEASQGETYDEFAQVFGFPKERSELRETFERVLARYQNRDAAVALPSFQTWFYVYRNNSVREDYKQLLERYYHVEVKDISRQEFDWSEPNTSLQLEGGIITEPSNSKDVIGFETLKRINLDDDAPSPIGDTYGEEVLNKEASKFDREVDDKQYVEKPVALAEAELQLQRDSEPERELTTEETATTEADSTTTAPVEKQEKPAEIALTVEENVAENKQNKRSEGKQSPSVEENETVQEDEKLRKQLSEQSGNSPALVTASEPEKVRLPLQKLENVVKTIVKEGADEIMIALESQLGAAARVTQLGH